MNDRELKQLVAELVEAQGAAIGLVVAAISCQLDPARLSADLRLQLSAAKAMGTVSPLAIHLATDALAVVDAETALRQQANH